jgi:hypothetical protein
LLQVIFTGLLAGLEYLKDFRCQLTSDDKKIFSFQDRVYFGSKTGDIPAFSADAANKLFQF